jgi:hypothetical protein
MPEYERGRLRVRCADGVEYSVRAPRSLADNLSLCHPENWGTQLPPHLREFDDPTWYEPLQDKGLVLV